jgi:hypothetical protein
MGAEVLEFIDYQRVRLRRRESFRRLAEGIDDEGSEEVRGLIA